MFPQFGVANILLDTCRIFSIPRVGPKTEHERDAVPRKLSLETGMEEKFALLCILMHFTSFALPGTAHQPKCNSEISEYCHAVLR